MELTQMARFSDVEEHLDNLRANGMIFPTQENLTTPSVLEIIGLCEYLMCNKRESLNQPHFAIGYYESESIQAWFALNDEVPPTKLTDLVTIGEIVDQLSLAMRLSMQMIVHNKAMLYRYAVYLDVRRETGKAYMDIFPDGTPNEFDTDYMGTAMTLLAKIVQYQNRDYKEPPYVKYNDITRRLELTYSIPARDIAQLMAIGYM